MSLKKECKNCKIIKDECDFYLQKSGDKTYRNNICIGCTKIKQKEYRNKNKEKIRQINKNYYSQIKGDPSFKIKQKEYIDKNKDKKRLYDKKYRENNKEKYRAYCINNKDKIAKVRHEYYLLHKDNICIYNKIYFRKYYIDNRFYIINRTSQYLKNRRRKNSLFRLRINISRAILRALKIRKECSIFKKLQYSIGDLKLHLENKFEVWMSWDNYGVYRVNTWDDNDQSTWTWQIDHIIPQSKLPYASMDDDNFKRCWALENLRPLSAKQNLLKGDVCRQMTDKIKGKIKEIDDVLDKHK